MYIEFNEDVLIVELPNQVIGSTIIKQKAELNYLLYQPKDHILKIGVRIIPFAQSEKDEFAARLDSLPGSNFRIVERELSALLDMLVDVTTGAELCKLSEQYSIDNSDADNPIQTLNPLLEKKDYARQFDYYQHVAKNVPVVIEQLISAKILENLGQ